MSEVHVFSVKVGASHGLWQYKLSGTHDRIMLHGLRDILDGTCSCLGFDGADRSIVYLLSFSAEHFEGWQVCVERMKEAGHGRDRGCYYRVSYSTIGHLEATGLFPAFINSGYLRAWPERIYYKLEKSAGGIVN